MKLSNKQLSHQNKQFLSTPKIVLLLLVLILGTEATANATAASVHEIADICMLSNRVLKDYSLIGMVQIRQTSSFILSGQPTLPMPAVQRIPVESPQLS